MQPMLKGLIVVLGAAWLVGCASTMEDVNQGAKDAGRPVGGVARLPGSVMEGAAEGTAGQPKANPYNR